MSGIERRLVAWVFLLVAGCVGPVGPPALVLGVSHVTRRRVTERASEERREVVVSAAVEVALQQLGDFAAVMPVDVVPRAAWDAAAVGCEGARALCAWAEGEEHEAWIALLEESEVVP